jgi:hypothetical protein
MNQLLAFLYTALRGVAQNRVIGRKSAGTGRAELLDGADLRTIAGVYSTSEVDSALSGKANSSHNHTTTDITGFGEAVDDEVASLLVAGTNISITYNDAANTLTIANTASGGSPGGTTGQVQFNDAGSFGGATAVVYAATGAHVTVTAQGSTIVPVSVKGAASQAADLQEWRNAANTLLGSVSAFGWLTLPLYVLASGSIFGQSGNITLTTHTGAGTFNLLRFGGATAATPALKISGTKISIRLANDSADADFSAKAITASGEIITRNGTSPTSIQITNTYTSPTSFGLLDIRANAAQTAYEISSFLGSAGGANLPINIGHRDSAGTFTNALSVATTGAVTIGAFTLPTTDGTTGQVLQTNGSGTVTWQTAAGGGASVGRVLSYALMGV